jgi:TonB family protein
VIQFHRWSCRRPEDGAGWGGFASLGLHALRREAPAQRELEIVWEEDAPETVGEGGNPMEEAEPPSPPPSLVEPPRPELVTKPVPEAALPDALPALPPVVQVPPSPPPRAYPEMSRLRGEQGVVVLELAIGTDGRVVTTRIARSSGFGRLDEAARRAAQAWRFRPALVEGQPTLAMVQTSVQFRLQ